MATAKKSRRFERGHSARARTSKPVSSRLFISFWSLCLDNLPLGVFNHRMVTAKEAKRLIDEARTGGAMAGVSDDDLLAPYHKRDKDNHAKLCRTLSKHYDIQLSLKDFVVDYDEGDGKVGYSINPLQFAEIGRTNRLLLVNCHFVMRERQKRGRIDFDIAPDSATFHLFEAVGSTSKPRTPSPRTAAR